MITVLAHVKWFTDETAPLDLGRLASLPVLGAILLAAALIALLGWLSRRMPLERAMSWPRRVLRPFLPLILSAHLAIALTASALTGRYLAPNLELPQGSTGTLLTGIELAVALLILAGFFTRFAAGLLVLSGPAGMVVYGPLAILERAELLGIALYLALTGRRRWSVDALRGERTEEGIDPAAVGLLRMLAGLAVAVNAFTEKLLAPEVGLALLEDRPGLNVLRGLGVSDAAFSDLAGAVELALGLVLISGIGTRLAVLVAVIPFNLTLLVFGWEELVGHLPIYGIFLVLLIEGSGRARSALRWFRESFTRVDAEPAR
ncbi:MAG TPA: hypothetical protein VEA19_06065 [Actinomycetota bacterium]|nr:hypothetical protein [Actinomycetota bacterium]